MKENKLNQIKTNQKANRKSGQIYIYIFLFTKLTSMPTRCTWIILGKYTIGRFPKPWCMNAQWVGRTIGIMVMGAPRFARYANT